MSNARATLSEDQAAIKNHVVDLFDAFLAGDVESLRRGRTADWKGFQVRSTRLIRGVADYMSDLDDTLGTLRVERYEFIDFEVDVDGDTGIVCYLARDFLQSSGSGPSTVLIRSIDVYKRIDGSWLQTASNICAIPDPFSAGDGAPENEPND